MPFKSRAQQKYMYAAAERGEIPEKTVSEWANKTKFSKLPVHVGEKGDMPMTDEERQKEMIKMLSEKESDTCPHCGQPMPKAGMKEGSPAEEASETPEEEKAESDALQQQEEEEGTEKNGRLFGKQKGPAVHVMIAVGKGKRG